VEGVKIMRKILVTISIYVMLTASVAWGQDAMYVYNRGLESSLAYKRVEYFTKALQLNPNLVEAYEKRAIHYYYQWKYDKAINDYTKIIELKPRSVEAHKMRGLCYLKQEKLEGAIADLSHAIELDPQLASAYGYRAEAYRLKGMAEEALHDSTMAIDLRGDPRTIASAYRTRAKAHQQLGHDKQSDADFDKSFELDPRYAIYRYFASTSNLEGLRRIGLLGIITLSFIGIFRLGLHAPSKKGQY
jgi:tetratricopeptide (TPR) repeat protein